MKAKYILAAIEAMRDADRLSYTTIPSEFAHIQGKLAQACYELERESGLGEIEISIEHEQEGRYGQRAFGPDCND